MKISRAFATLATTGSREIERPVEKSRPTSWLGPAHAIAHRLCRLIWMILHQAIRYEERGPAVSRSTTERRAAKMIRELRRLGYRIEPGECKAEGSV